MDAVKVKAKTGQDSIEVARNALAGHPENDQAIVTVEGGPVEVFRVAKPDTFGKGVPALATVTPKGP